MAILKHIETNTPLPPFFPYPRFFLDSSLPQTARLVYALLLDRATLSQKNGWTDESGAVFVIYTLKNLAETLRCDISSVKRALKQLVEAKLIRRERTAFSAPNRIFVSIPESAQTIAQNRTATEGGDAPEDSAEMPTMTVQGCATNQLILNQQNYNQRSGERNSRAQYGKYDNVLLAESEYAQLQSEFPDDYSHRIEDLSEYMAATGKGYKNHLATIRSWAKRETPKRLRYCHADYSLREDESL